MAALATVIDALDKVSEPLRQFYEQKDGKFYLKLDGVPSGFVLATELATANGKVVEFRDTNVKLLKEVEDLRPLKVKFEGIDPEAAKTAIAEVAALKAKGVTKPDDIAVQIQAAVTAANKPLQDQLKTMQGQLDTSNAATVAERLRADESVLRSAVSEKFIKAGGKSKAIDFIIGAAKSTFKVVGGEVTAQPNKFSAERPGDPLSVDEWLITMAKENDFAFAPSTGSGAAPVQGAPPFKPGQTILKDPTPQQLGERSKEISKGTVRVEYTQPAPQR